MKLADWKARGHEVVCGGHAMFYADSAPDAHDRPTIFLIHGFPTASWDWHKLWPDLSARFRLVAPDLLGFGYSDKPRRHVYSIHEQADLMEELIARIGLRSFHVLAHDYGDTVAQEMLARQNAKPEADRQWLSVCFLNGGLFPETHRARLIQKLLLGPLGPAINALTGRATFDRTFSAVFGPDTRPTAAELDAFWTLINEKDGRHIFHKLITYMRDRREHRQRWVAALADACVPVQIINGSLDPVSGAHMVARYRELICSDNIVELSTIGHYPQVEAPAAVLDAYLAFLDRTTAAGPGGTAAYTTA